MTYVYALMVFLHSNLMSLNQFRDTIHKNQAAQWSIGGY